MYHSKLIDIFAAIKKRKSDAYLLLLGGGELQDTIKNKVEKLNLCDSVIFCGVRTDVNKYLSSKSFLEKVKNYKSSIRNRIVFLLCKDINCGIIASDMITRIIILFGCY